MLVSWLRTTIKSFVNKTSGSDRTQYRNSGQPMSAIGNQNITGDEDNPSVNAKPRCNELAHGLQREMAKLDEESKQILRMRFSEGQPLKTIANSLNTTEDKVRYRIRQLVSGLQLNL